MGKPIANAVEILAYLGEVIDENGLDKHIRYQHTISSARWSSAENLWTIEATRMDKDETVRLMANFLWMCQGYYRHDQGYTPAWDGMDEFNGPIVHPQAWPEDLDYAGKNVVVIGSGATAATLVPAIAADCAHVTMLQRSPTYFITGRDANALADMLRELDINQEWIHEIVRRKVLFDQVAFTRRCLQRAGGRNAGAAFGGSRLPRRRLRCGHPLRPEISALAAAHRLHSGWRSLPRSRLEEGICRHR